MKTKHEQIIELTDREFQDLLPILEYVQSSVLEGVWLKKRPPINLSSEVRRNFIGFLNIQKTLPEVDIMDMPLFESEDFESFPGVHPFEALRLLQKHFKHC